MLSSLISSLIISLSISLLPITAPIILGLIILLISLSISVMLALFSSSWLALVMFIIYIGGMLIMFAYFSALQPNNQLHPVATAMIFLSLYFLFLSPNLFPHAPSSMTTFSINKFVEFNNFPIYFLLMLILLLTLIAVVKITTINKSPLRPFS